MSATATTPAANQVSKSEFIAQAEPITVVINGQSFSAVPQMFSTGSVGYYINGKIPCKLKNGKTVTLQVGCNLTGVKSKEWQA